VPLHRSRLSSTPVEVTCATGVASRERLALAKLILKTPKSESSPLAHQAFVDSSRRYEQIWWSAVSTSECGSQNLVTSCAIRRSVDDLPGGYEVFVGGPGDEKRYERRQQIQTR